MSHKKIMEKCSDKLMKDANHYKKEMKQESGAKKAHERTEMREASSAAKEMKARAKKAHEY